MIKRPGRGESEEDLLKFQEEYFASKQQPSVTLQKKKDVEENKQQGEKQRDVVVLDNTDSNANVTSDAPKTFSFKKSSKRFHIKDEDIDAAKDLDDKDKEHISTVLSNIQEHFVTGSGQFKADYYKTGFPTAPSLEQVDSSCLDGTKKKSLFAQQFKAFSKSGALGKAPVVFDTSIKKDVVSGASITLLPKKSNINKPSAKCSKELASGSVKPNVSISNEDSSLSATECENIHKENMNRLNEMSHQDILEEREKLMSSLDPSLISFLKSKGKETSSQISTPMPDEKAKSVPDDEKPAYLPEESKKISEEVKDTTVELDPHKEFDIKKDYVHMSDDYIEHEKLAWMKDLPKVKLNKDDCLPRFDFEGVLMSLDEDTPVSVGLHHHGEDPSLPGYTLEELFHMVRSNFPTQRVLALQVLSRIMEKYHQHVYHGKLSTDLLVQCLDAGLLFILRWSLDEHAEQIYSAAVAALAYVVYVQCDQEAVDSMFFTLNGSKIPSLCTYYKKKTEDMTQEEQEEDHDLTDAEIIRLDVVKGLLQIQILPRLRYVMEVCQPSDAAIRNCFKIIIRIVQHNKESAYELFKYTPLLELVMKIVKTKQLTNNEESVVYALKLIKYICIAGKNMASKLVSSYNFEEVIGANLSPKNTHTELLVETCMIWKILLNYGLLETCAGDLYSTLMSQLQSAMSCYKETDDRKLAALLHVVEAITRASIRGEINWSIVDGLQQIVFHCLNILQKDMMLSQKITRPLFTDAILQSCSAYFITKNKMEEETSQDVDVKNQVSEVSPVDLLQEVEEFWSRHLDVILNTQLLNKLLGELRTFSDFQSKKEEKSDKNLLAYESPSNLPNYGTYILHDGQPCSIKQDSPVSLTLSLFNLAVQLMKINKKLLSKALPVIVAVETKSYLRLINESKELSRASVLLTTRIELFLLAFLLEIFELTGSSVGFVTFDLQLLNLYQEVAFQIISLLQPGDERYVLHLMDTVIFNPKVFRKQNYVLWFPPDNYTGITEEDIKRQLLVTRTDLMSIGSMYKTLLFGSKFDCTKDTDSCLTPSRQASCLPQDWTFYPLVELYDMAMRIEQSGGMIGKASDETINNTKKCLQFLLLLETTRSSLLVNVEETLRLTRFMCIFLTEGELYKESLIVDLVSSLTLLYSSPSFQYYLDFEKNIPGITSFYDFYCSLVQQYLASSFGDYNFANLLLLPMMLSNTVKYRRAIWSEFDDILRLFPLPFDKLVCDVKKMLAATIEDNEMIDLYYQALIKGKVKPTWCPVYYLIAIHHVNQYIFSTSIKENGSEEVPQNGTMKQRHMLKQILSLRDKEVKDDVIAYQSFDGKVKHGLHKFIVLPPSRELMLRSITEVT